MAVLGSALDNRTAGNSGQIVPIRGIDLLPKKLDCFGISNERAEELFRKVKDHWKKAEAATIIQNVLESHKAAGGFFGDPAKAANVIVGKAWDTRPEYFDGRFGQRPHKAVLAISALAIVVDAMGEDSAYRELLMLCLCQLLAYMEKQAFLFNLTALDEKLLVAAMRVADGALTADPLGAEVATLMRLGEESEAPPA